MVEIFILLILISIFLTYKKSFVDQNFELVGEEEVVE